MQKRYWIGMVGLLLMGILCINGISYLQQEDPVYIPPSIQRTGNAEAGYQYLVTGDFLKSGLPYGYFVTFNGKNNQNYLQRTGKNATVPHGFNVIKATNGTEVVIPTCLQCHAQVLNDSLIVGLGNNTLDFTQFGKKNSMMQALAKTYMRAFSPKKYEAAAAIMRSLSTVAPYLKTEVQGVNAADRLAVLLVAHRDPETLQWRNKPLLDIPDEVVPTDVPAWWILKKKHAMFYNGFGRGDFGRFLMLSNLLTVKDTTEAREVFSHFADVLSYIKSIEAPKYPLPIDAELAVQGKLVFMNSCSGCHGTYGTDGKYPNLLIPGSIIQTDSLLYKANYQNPQFIDWFNKSWFAQGELPARLVPFNGYIAPPLDGVWATAPYLHNGSVPSLEAVINSKLRPEFWQRDFYDKPYLTDKMSVNYIAVSDSSAKNIYNTRKKGYGNTGHYFGDHLDAKARKAVLEYLKTL